MKTDLAFRFFAYRKTPFSRLARQVGIDAANSGFRKQSKRGDRTKVSPPAPRVSPRHRPEQPAEFAPGPAKMVAALGGLDLPAEDADRRGIDGRGPRLDA